MTQFFADRDEEPTTSELLNLTTANRVTVLYERLRNGESVTAFRKTSETPPRYHMYHLNEHGAYCDDREYNRKDAHRKIDRIRDSDGYLSGDCDAREKLWPGPPEYKHPSRKRGKR